jgi:uncharacterized protein YdiU (UPF0061 family)
MRTKFPDEFRLHEFYKDWERCTLNRQNLSYWTKKYPENKKTEKFDLEKRKRKKTILPKIILNEFNHHQIASKALELKKMGDGKWSLKYHHPQQHKLFKKFNDFKRCSITKKIIACVIKKQQDPVLCPRNCVKNYNRI